uniref:Uncharacterized protein n=1 Tax=Rhizophora mucronata TaxID=61149 RepID=A0A2P2M525_RHIMU
MECSSMDISYPDEVLHSVGELLQMSLACIANQQQFPIQELTCYISEYEIASRVPRVRGEATPWCWWRRTSESGGPSPRHEKPSEKGIPSTLPSLCSSAPSLLAPIPPPFTRTRTRTRTHTHRCFLQETRTLSLYLSLFL